MATTSYIDPFLTGMNYDPCEDQLRYHGRRVPDYILNRVRSLPRREAEMIVEQEMRNLRRLEEAAMGMRNQAALGSIGAHAAQLQNAVAHGPEPTPVSKPQPHRKELLCLL